MFAGSIDSSSSEDESLSSHVAFKAFFLKCMNLFLDSRSGQSFSASWFIAHNLMIIR